MEEACNRDQRHSVPSAEAEAAAVERLRRRLDAHVGKLHGLTPAQANKPLLEAIAAASVGLGMAAQRLAAYEAAEVTRVQSEGPLQRGAGVAEPTEAEEVTEEAKKLGDQLVRGWCGEESEEPQWLLEAGRVVAAERPYMRECCACMGGGGCGEADGREVEVDSTAPAAAWEREGGVEMVTMMAIRLQCAARGLDARKQLEWARSLEDRRAERAALVTAAAVAAAARRQRRRLEYLGRKQAEAEARRETRDVAAAVLAQTVQELVGELAEELEVQERACLEARAGADVAYALSALLGSLLDEPNREAVAVEVVTHSEAEVTPEKERVLWVPKRSAKERAAVQAQRSLHMSTGEGAGEARDGAEGPLAAAAAVRLQRAVRGVAARRVLKQKLLVRRRMEASARLAVREAEERARREAEREAARRAKEWARREARLDAKLDAKQEVRRVKAMRDGPRRRGLAEGATRKEGHFAQDHDGQWWEVAGQDRKGEEFFRRCDAQGVAEALEVVRRDKEERTREMRRRRYGGSAR